MPSLRPVPPGKLSCEIFRLIDQEWMLVTAGTMKRWNTMTASWGGLGTLWNRPVAFCFVRPTRYTYGFMEKSRRFTLSFFSREYRKQLLFCGTKSGRDVDKAKATGLTPVAGAQGTVYFKQARMVFECRKLYFQDIQPDNVLDRSIHKLYPKKDYHRMYIGEVTRLLVRR